MNLYPYQQEGVAWLMRHPRALLADEMGLGKTAQAIMASAEFNGPTLIVCPNSVKANWAREIYRWIPGERTWMLRAGASRAPREVDYMIVNYELLERVLDRTWRTLIFDEATYLKSADAKRTKRAYELAERAERVWLLSGTPVMNRPYELVAPLQILRGLEHFGGRWAFVNRYCDPQRQWIWTRGRGRPMRRQIMTMNGAKNLPELSERLTSLGVMLRRTRSDVGLQLPPCQTVKVALELTGTALSSYRSAAADLRVWIAKHRGSEAAMRAIRAEKLTRVGYLRAAAADAKTPAMLDWVADLMAETDEKVVVFADSRALQQAFMRRWPNAAHLLGDDSASMRQTQLDRLVRDPNCRLFVASLRAAGMGINEMVAAPYCVFADQAWTPALHQQAVDRLHRPGQKKAVTAYYIVAESTIEERIVDVLMDKDRTAQLAIDGEAIDRLIDEELAA